MNFSVKDLHSKYEQIRSFLQIALFYKRYFSLKIFVFVCSETQRRFFINHCNQSVFENITDQYIHCTKNEVFHLSISSVNVIKSEVSCGFGHIYLRNP